MTFEREEDVQLVLEDEEGQEHEFIFIDRFELDDEEYVILQPVGEDEQYIFKLSRDEDGEEYLSEIEDEEEWERIADLCRELILNEDL
ncbi:MAG: DUF1292 domain-containing protein [Thermacetogeniaceae bacterium]|jgi:uncharacterized protein YrzB (UPF0473 family)|nr:DUF1292 domain-containing protein [Syntrophomonadaceae bacterium]